MRFKKKPNLSNVTSSVDKQKLTEKILAAADQPFSSTSPQLDKHKIKPWENILVEKDKIVFSFRIPKKEMQQLKYISKCTGSSLNAICLRAIRQVNKKMLKEIEADS